jgi:hypothetical protein
MTEDSGAFKTNPADFTPIWPHKMNAVISKEPDSLRAARGLPRERGQ